MSMEVCDGCQFAYVIDYSAARKTGRGNTVNTSLILMPANSEDEARGKAIRAAELTYLRERGWYNHSVGNVIRIDDVDWVGETDWDAIEPVQ